MMLSLPRRTFQKGIANAHPSRKIFFRRDKGRFALGCPMGK